MRPWLALTVCAIILGGLQLFMQFRPHPSPPAPPAASEHAAGQFRVELTLSFVAGPDEFSVEAATAPSLLLSLDGHEVLRRTDVVEAGETVVVERLTGLQVGPNEFYLQASPREATTTALAIRLRIWRNEQVVAEQSFWSQPGERVEGTVVLTLSRDATRKEPEAHTARTGVATEYE